MYMCGWTGLKFLVRICTDLGLKEAADYAVELKRAEKYKEMRDERLKSGRPSSKYSAVQRSLRLHVYCIPEQH